MANEKRLIDAELLVPIIEAEITDSRADILNRALRAVLDLINGFPTVDAVEVVQGRWLVDWHTTLDPISCEYDEFPEVTCPFCDYKECGMAYDDYWGKPHNYCPNCGAKMDGGNEAA